MADEEVGWELAACGGSGKTFIDVEQSLGEVERWRLMLQFPSTQMWMAIQGPHTITEMFEFFSETTNSHSQQAMNLGFYFGLPVTLVKDEEFADRYFIWVRGGDSHGRSDYLQIALFGEGTTDFMTSLAKVVDDLEN